MATLRDLMNDRRAPWIAGGVGALVGGVVWLRRRKAGGLGVTGVASTGSGAQSVILPAVANTVGTDIYNSLQPQIEFLQRQGEALGANQASLLDIMQGLGTPASVESPLQPSGFLWDTFQGQQFREGKLTIPPGGARDWGMIAAQRLGGSATKDAVWNYSLRLHQANPGAAQKYPMAVPADKISSLVYPAP